MAARKKSIWFNAEAEYLGARGVDSLREMAELIAGDGYFLDILDLDEDATVEAIVEVLDWLHVSAELVPVGHFYREVWDGAYTFPCALDASPGRGYTKVLGASV